MPAEYPTSNDSPAISLKKLILNTAEIVESGLIPSPRATVVIPASNIDWSASNTFSKTLSANTTFTFSNDTDGQTIVVAITNTAGNYTVAWPAAVQWSGGTEPVQTIGAFTDVITFVKIGSTIYGSSVQNFS